MFHIVSQRKVGAVAQPQNGWHQGKANLAICANIQTSIDVKENYFKVPVHMYTSIILYYIYIILYIHTDPPITHRNIYNYMYVYIYTCTHFYSVSNMYVYIYICTKKEELGNRQDPPRTLSIRHQGKGAGTGTAAYSSVEEVAQAIATLNG